MRSFTWTLAYTVQPSKEEKEDPESSSSYAAHILKLSKDFLPSLRGPFLPTTCRYLQNDTTVHAVVFQPQFLATKLTFGEYLNIVSGSSFS